MAGRGSASEAMFNMTRKPLRGHTCNPQGTMRGPQNSSLILQGCCFKGKGGFAKEGGRRERGATQVGSTAQSSTTATDMGVDSIDHLGTCSNPCAYSEHPDTEAWWGSSTQHSRSSGYHRKAHAVDFTLLD
jgi:hypothetical protein